MIPCRNIRGRGVIWEIVENWNEMMPNPRTATILSDVEERDLIAIGDKYKRIRRVRYIGNGQEPGISLACRDTYWDDRACMDAFSRFVAEIFHFGCTVLYIQELHSGRGNVLVRN